MSDNVWSFGYGSNMDVKALEAKKHVKIVDHTPAVLKDYRMSFSLKGIPNVEPAYANIKEEKGEEVHGVAFCMTKDSMEELDRTEIGYNKKSVILYGYDGRELNGFIYTSKKEPAGEYPPSARYLGVLVKGARQAGLREDYVTRLASTRVYEVTEAIKQIRAARPDPASLHEISVDELAEHKEWIAVLGYIVQPPNIWFNSHKGRDLTTRMLMQFHGIPLEDNDDRGRPPYPLVKDLTPEELEYVTRWLDHYEAGHSPNHDEATGKMVGFLKEFKEQQAQGVTQYVLPGHLKT